MLILDKHRALERIVSLAERLREAVPEPYSLRASTFMAMPPPEPASGGLPRWPGVPGLAEPRRGAPLLADPLR